MNRIVNLVSSMPPNPETELETFEELLFVDHQKFDKQLAENRDISQSLKFVEDRKDLPQNIVNLLKIIINEKRTIAYKCFRIAQQCNLLIDNQNCRISEKSSLLDAKLSVQQIPVKAEPEALVDYRDGTESVNGNITFEEGEVYEVQPYKPPKLKEKGVKIIKENELDIAPIKLFITQPEESKVIPKVQNKLPSVIQPKAVVKPVTPKITYPVIGENSFVQTKITHRQTPFKKRIVPAQPPFKDLEETKFMSNTDLKDILDQKRVVPQVEQKNMLDPQSSNSHKTLIENSRARRTTPVKTINSVLKAKGTPVKKRVQKEIDKAQPKPILKQIVKPEECKVKPELKKREKLVEKKFARRSQRQSIAPRETSIAPRESMGRNTWERDEHIRFLNAVKKYGKNWPLITIAVGGNRTKHQCQCHGAHYVKKMNRLELKSEVLIILMGPAIKLEYKDRGKRRTK